MNRQQRKELGSMTMQELVGLALMNEDAACNCNEDCRCEEPHLLTPTGVELYPIDARALLREYRDVLNGLTAAHKL